VYQRAIIEIFSEPRRIMRAQAISNQARLVALLAIPIFACSRGEPETAYASSSTGRTAVASQGAVSKASEKGTALRLVLASSGNAARYRVREQLVGQNLPNDAVGETTKLTGAISIDANGKVIRDVSKFTVDAGSFVSDKNRRDGFVRGRLLEADEYPTIVFVPTSVSGVSLPLPTSGTRQIEMTGDLTVRGVTRPRNWKGTVEFKNGGVTGSVSTAFTFDDIQLEQPRVPVLLSVADTIKLEIDFNLVPQR
jgi:polyisoprenoid-binding protein YceI